METPQSSQRLLRRKTRSAAESSPVQEPRTKSRTPIKRDVNDHCNPSTRNKKTPKKKEEITIRDASADGFVRFMPRSKSVKEVPTRTRSASNSPSAWALSPGRSSPSPPVMKLAGFETMNRERKSGGGGGGVSAVLKLFRQKKVCPLLAEEYHRFRVVHNRLLQWRFANARAEATMATVNRAAQKKLFNGWARISLTRKFIIEKRNQVLKLKHQIKLYEIMKSQMQLLTEWSRIEAKNCEAVGRVARKLSAISVCLPLVDGAEAQLVSFHDAVTTATTVVDSLEAMIADMHKQIETASYVLTELMITLKQHEQYFEELEKRVTVVLSLHAHENSLRVNFIQGLQAVKTG